MSLRWDHTDDEILAAFTKMLFADQLVVMQAIYRIDYRKAVNTPWIQRWINDHCAAVSSEVFPSDKEVCP